MTFYTNPNTSSGFPASRTMSQSCIGLSSSGPVQSGIPQTFYDDTQNPYVNPGHGFGRRTFPLASEGQPSTMTLGRPVFPVSPSSGIPQRQAPPLHSPNLRVNSSTTSPAAGTPVSGLENLVESLQISIANGEVDQAKQWASLLAGYKTKIQMMVEKVEVEQSDLRLRVYIEYKESSAASIVLTAGLKDTIADLKRKMLLHYSLPTKLQRWIIGKRLPADTDTLESLGVTSNTSEAPVYLYMMSAKFAGINREQVEREIRQISGIPEPSDPDIEGFEVVSHPSMEAVPAEASPARPQMHAPPPRPASVSGPIAYEERMTRPAGQPMRMSTGQINEVTGTVTHPQEPVQEERQLKWQCPACTYENFPTWPGCEICNTERPADFEIPQGYVPTPRERQRMMQESTSEEQFRESQEQQRREAHQQQQRNFSELIQLDNRELVANTSMFECPVCYDMIPAGDGVVLRECLHSCCRQCLAAHVSNYDGAQVPCPDVDCGEFLQDREVRAVVSPEVFMKYLSRSVNLAENRTPNSFHCKTADCHGWVIYDDDVNFFICDVCGHNNCLTCKAIHEGMNCREYQTELQLKAQNDDAARKTQEMLQNLLAKGEAMNCPSCLIVLQKKDGCDWMRCTMCGTEICWATRGPRWGPNGAGDTSGGCLCRINARKCHPKCQNCH